jgi:hypothetical protein
MSNNSVIFTPIPIFLRFFNTPLSLINLNKDIITLPASQEAKFYYSLGISAKGNKLEVLIGLNPPSTSRLTCTTPIPKEPNLTFMRSE